MKEFTILGAGIFGLSAAFEALLRGHSVQVIDPGGVAAGASGGIVGALAPHVPENWNAKKEFQFQSLIAAGAFWAKVGEIAQTPTSYARTGRIQPILDDHQLSLAQARHESAKTLWQGQATWEILSQLPSQSWTVPSPTGQYIFDTLTGRIFPRIATQALAQAVRTLGGTINTQGAHRGLLIDARGAAGLIEMAAQLDRPIGNAVKGQAALLRASAPEAPQLFTGALHIVPHSNRTVAIGSTSEREFDAAQSTDAQLDALIAKAARLCPALATAPVLERWAGLRPRAKSRAPMIGPHPVTQGAWVMNGGFKIGFGMAPKLATTLLDAIEGDDLSIIPPEFLPQASL